MKLVIGLGNPGEEYVGTRHNVGREVVRMLADDWKMERKLHVETTVYTPTKGTFVSTKVPFVVRLALPTTYMNESGKAVKKIVSQFPSFLISNLVIVHDDIDLPLGSVRISVGASAGGHNGVQSIIDNLGTKEFTRVRIGVAGIGRSRTDAATYVLKKFTKGEQTKLKSTLDRAQEAIAMIMSDGVEKTMNIYNGSRNL